MSQMLNSAEMAKKNVRLIPASIHNETKSKPRRIRTAAYCRVSTDSKEQELSFETQVTAYTDKIMSNPDWAFVGVFTDEGVSGTQAEKRKGFMKMIRLCRQEKIDQILTKSVSRFARNTVDCLNYIRELKALGISVIFEKEGLNTSHMSSEIYISMHGIFAQSESESLSGNVRWGKQKSAEKGNVSIHCKGFLGYEKDKDGNPQIMPEEAETVRFIYNTFLEGDSIASIKNKLERKGMLTPKGNKVWNTSTIRSILKNEKYKGDALLCKTYVRDCIGKTVVKNTDRPKYYVENSHPAIVSMETFDNVQMEFAKRSNVKKKKEKGVKTELGKYSGKYALTELLVCGKCGSPYRRTVWRDNNNEKRPVWRCISRLDYGKKYCKESPTLDEKPIHDAVANAIKEIAGDDGCRIAVENLKIHIKMYYGSSDEYSTYEDELELNKLKEEVIQKAMSNDAGSDEFIWLSEKINELKKQIEDKRKNQIKFSCNKGRANEVINILDTLKNHPIEYDDNLVRLLVDCIKVISKKELVVIFKGGVEVNVDMV